MQASTHLRPRSSHDEPPTPEALAQRIGTAAGVGAGLVYLLFKCAVAATLQDGAGSEPLLRISAVLLGTDVLPPAGELDGTTGLISLLVFLGVAAIYGNLLAPLFRGRPLRKVLLRGAIAGAAIYWVHYYLVAPHVFAWFTEVRDLPTALAHVLFGMAMGFLFHRGWRKHQP